MKFDPTDALNRMPDFGNNTEGENNLTPEKDPDGLEYEKENATVVSFFKIPDLAIDQEFEGDLEEPTNETGTDHADSWGFYMDRAVDDGIRKDPELFAYLQEQSKEKLAIDLGCGGNQEYAISTTKKLGCMAYLGVDKFNVGRDYMKSGDPTKKVYHRNVLNVTKMRDPENSLPAVVMRSEMLDALKLIKDNSSVVIFNGIEEELFTFMPLEKRVSYFSGVADEVRRVVGKDGYIISTEPHMLVRWGNLKLSRDEKFHNACNPHSITGQPELYRIDE